MKVVINRQYGGFDLSLLAKKRYLELQGKECYCYAIDEKNIFINHKVSTDSASVFSFVCTKDFGETMSGNEQMQECFFDCTKLDRNDPILISVVEKLGEKANTGLSTLKIVEIPDGTDYKIRDYGGMETVEEAHKSWC